MPEDEGLAVVAGDLGVGDYETTAVDEEAARERAAEGAKVAQAAGFAAEPSSVLASPTWMGILDTADKVDAPVIVVGSRGLDRLRADLQGSTSHDLALHAGQMRDEAGLLVTVGVWPLRPNHDARLVLDAGWFRPTGTCKPRGHGKVATSDLLRLV
jgi:hypothetical protein